MRRLLWCPTSALEADGLTERMLSKTVYDLLAYGYRSVKTKEVELLVATTDLPSIIVNESDLLNMKPPWAGSPSVCKSFKIARHGARNDICISFL